MIRAALHNNRIAIITNSADEVGATHEAVNYIDENAAMVLMNQIATAIFESRLNKLCQKQLGQAYQAQS